MALMRSVTGLTGTSTDSPVSLSGDWYLTDY
jgi:hypothetical protein